MSFTTDTQAFFTELAANNNREWFQANKARYTEFVKEPAEALARQMANRLEADTDKTWQPKIFRIYRDIRFSKGKTPYKARQGMTFRQAGSGSKSHIGYFLAVEADHVTVGGGAFIWEKQDLNDYRAWLMADDNAERLQNAVDGLKDAGFDISDAALKRMPREFDKDFPFKDLACRKGLRLWKNDYDCADLLGQNLADYAHESFRKMSNLMEILETIKAPFKLPDGL